MSSKHIPLRKCVACNQSKPKKDLIRIVKQSSQDKSATVTIDDTYKMSGRGTYICKNLDCLTSAKKFRRLERKLSQKISEDFYRLLESKINSNE